MLALGSRPLRQLLAELEGQRWVEKGFGLIDNYYLWVAGVELKQYPGKCLYPVANGADIQRLAHVRERFVMEPAFIRGRGLSEADI